MRKCTGRLFFGGGGVMWMVIYGVYDVRGVRGGLENKGAEVDLSG